MKKKIPTTQNSSFSNISNQSTKLNSDKSTVSFNNSKNFSLYNQNTSINKGPQNESSLGDA